jgi:hypothetical protein
MESCLSIDCAEILGKGKQCKFLTLTTRAEWNSGTVKEDCPGLVHLYSLVLYVPKRNPLMPIGRWLKDWKAGNKVEECSFNTILALSAALAYLYLDEMFLVIIN